MNILLKGEVQVYRIGGCLYSNLLLYRHRANQSQEQQHRTNGMPPLQLLGLSQSQLFVHCVHNGRWPGLLLLCLKCVSTTHLHCSLLFCVCGSDPVDLNLHLTENMTNWFCMAEMSIYLLAMICSTGAASLRLVLQAFDWHKSVLDPI